MVNTTINFRWEFKKRLERKPVAKADVSIARTKEGITVMFRNDVWKDFEPEMYVIFGFYDKLLGFMKSDKAHGYKVVKHGTNDNRSVRIKDENMVRLLSPFIGSYDMEINETNQIYIDRRHLK